MELPNTDFKMEKLKVLLKVCLRSDPKTHEHGDDLYRRYGSVVDENNVLVAE